MERETTALLDILENNYNQLIKTHRNLDKEIKNMYNIHSNEDEIKSSILEKIL